MNNEHLMVFCTVDSGLCIGNEYWFIPPAMKEWNIRPVRLTKEFAKIVTVKDLSDELLVGLIRHFGLGVDGREYVQEMLERFENRVQKKVRKEKCLQNL